MKNVTKKIQSSVLQQKYQEAEKETLQSEMFTSSVSHEMRTPINNCIFFITQLEVFFTMLINNH